MVDRKMILSTSFYALEHYSGSDNGIRYRIEATFAEDDEKKKKPLGLKCTVWPEPMSYEATDPGLMTDKEFDFSEEGLDAVKEWLDSHPIKTVS